MPPLRPALFAVLSAGAALAAAAETPAPLLKLAPCEIRASIGTRTMEADCGSWSVAEDPQQPNGKHIKLNVAVIKARAKDRDRAPDPVFLLAGGPGQSAIDGFMGAPETFDRILRRRDVVLVDQRGTGGSNRMQCPDDGPEAMLEDYDRALTIKRTRACMTKLPGDPALYTTSIAIDDLDAVRQALGYQQINLYGGSYGTRVALSYLKYHEDSTRAVIIDAVVPQDLTLGPGIAVESQRALEQMFARCAADPACHRSYPKLAEEFAELKARLTKAPVRFSMRDPVDGKPLEVKLSYGELSAAVRLLLYSPESVALLPVMLHQAAEGDYPPIAAQVLMSVRQTTSMLALGMHNSVICTEDVPYFVADPAGDAAQERSYLGIISSGVLIDMCSVWPRGPIKPGFKEPVKSAKPVLLLSGEYDPITPPAYAERAAATLANARHLIAPGQGHTVMSRGCLPRLAAEFLDGLDPKGLDAKCVAELGDTPLFVRFTGPEP